MCKLTSVLNRISVSALVSIVSLATGLDAFAEAIPVAELARDSEIEFGKEVLPILRKNCLACHNETDSEGDIVLESAASIVKGGSSGPGVVGRERGGELPFHACITR